MKKSNKTGILVIRSHLKNESYIREMLELTRSASYEIIKVFVQIRRENPRFNIGPGKLEEIKDFLKDNPVDVIVFGNRLKPRQAYNLEMEFGRKVIDRVQLILEIFSRHARTYEAKLQIKLARLNYELSRAKEKIKRMKMTELPGFHGPGRYPYDAYIRDIRRITATIQNKLKKIEKHRELHRLRRRKCGFDLVSLVGYTNAGKSTLFNAISNSAAEVSNVMFTTLTTMVRKLSSKPKILVSDTVGFIQDLPPMLIRAFKSTLEDILASDIILIIIDVSETVDEIKYKIDTCFKILDEIKAHNIPKIIVLNKIDLLTQSELFEKMNSLKRYFSTIIPISAKFRINVDKLIEVIENTLSPKYVTKTLSFENRQEATKFINSLFKLDPGLTYKIVSDENITKVVLNIRDVENIRTIINKYVAN